MDNIVLNDGYKNIVRQFYLIVDDSYKYIKDNLQYQDPEHYIYKLDLMGTDGFAYNPSGMGFDINRELGAIGNDKAIFSEEVNYDSLSFTIEFGLKGAPYKEFIDFTDKISKGPLKLLYVLPLGNGKTKEFTRDCAISKLSKSEIDKDTGLLNVDVDIDPLSSWYEWKKVDIIEGKDAIDIDDLDQYQIGVTSHSTVGMHMSYCPIKYMKCIWIGMGISYYKKDIPHYWGTKMRHEYYRLIFNKAVTTDDVIEISSDYNNFYARLYNKNLKTVTDLMPFLDNRSTFMFRLPTGWYTKAYIRIWGDPNYPSNETTDMLNPKQEEGYEQKRGETFLYVKSERMIV